MVADPVQTAVADTVAAMSLPEKVGQLFVVPLGRHSPNALRLPADLRKPGTEVAVDTLDGVVEAIRTYHVGGVCYFAPGPQGGAADEVRAELAELTDAVAGTGVSPVLSVDQEGGTVARLKRGVTSVPGAMALAATGDPASAEAAAAITGAELRAIGFHQNYAPDADVNSNPANPAIGVRSYGSDPDEVGRYVTAAVRGLRSAGMAATLKHFPGHGDTSGDSHLMLPTVDRNPADWRRIDLAPFAAALAAGVDAVMSAHVAVPAVDPSGDPATASPAILTGVLRDELGFTGPVVTDALDMAGARERFPHGEIAVRALLAGADQLLMPTDLPEAVAAVTAAVTTGRVPAARLDEAVHRILTLKHRLGLLGGAGPAPAPPVAAAANAATARRLARAAVTVLGDRSWRPGGGRIALVGALAGVEDDLVPVLRRGGAEVSVADTGSDPADPAAARDTTADLTVVVTRNATRYAGQRALLSTVDGAGPYVVLALRDPYDVGLAPGALARFATYGDNAVLREALCDVLSGVAEPGGRLPVDVLGPDGRVAYRRGSA